MLIKLAWFTPPANAIAVQIMSMNYDKFTRNNSVELCHSCKTFAAKTAM